MMDAAHAYNQSTTHEWATAQHWVELARRAMGSIDTDPCSSERINRMFIQADTYYTEESDGLHPGSYWRGNVYLNPPYGRGKRSAGAFLEKLRDEYKARRVKKAVVCLNLASLCSKWCSDVLPYIAQCYCIPYGRPQFIPPPGVDASQSTIGIVFAYVGDESHRFVSTYINEGTLLRPA